MDNQKGKGMNMIKMGGSLEYIILKMEEKMDRIQLIIIMET